ncbi:MAG: hypothetical protein IKS51_03225 [Erysipelotrichaceae bacterium]|nr:hypothetical protein [Erysipelotrichaceae bacterium]
MPDLICKARYFRMGEKAPKNSCFKGLVTPSSIFGGSGSYFSYTERYNRKEEESLLDYTGRYGYTMTSNGFLDTDEKKEAFISRGIESLQKPGAVVYEIICSMESYEKASRYSLTNQDQFSAVVTRIMPSYIRAIGLDPRNVTWWEDFHPENRTSIVPHPHIHLLFYEDEPSHTFDHLYGKLPRKAIKDFKRMFANEMIKRQDHSVYRETFKDIDLTKRDLLEKVQHIRFENIQTVKDLYAVLPEHGRLQINSANMAPYKDAIYKVVDNLLESDQCEFAWKNYLGSLKKYDYEVDDVTGDDVSSKSEKEISKTRQQIANMILQGRKDAIETFDYEEVVYNDNYKETDGDKGILYKDPSIVRDRLSSRNPDIPIMKGIGSLLAKRQREIEQEIEEYLDQDKGYSYGM